MKVRRHSLLIAAFGLSLAACGSRPAEEADTKEAADSEPAGEVTRTEVPEPAPEAPPAPQVATIQTQPGPDGAQVALNRVAVTGDVMTVQLSYRGEGGVQRVSLDQVSVIDDATAQQIGILKDNSGKWLASPLDNDGDELAINMWESPAVVWFKFPAPPPTSRTVSINIPKVAPFDGVPVTR